MENLIPESAEPDARFRWEVLYRIAQQFREPKREVSFKHLKVRKGKSPCFVKYFNSFVNGIGSEELSELLNASWLPQSLKKVPWTCDIFENDMDVVYFVHEFDYETEDPQVFARGDAMFCKGTNGAAVIECQPMVTSATSRLTSLVLCHLFWAAVYSKLSRGGCYVRDVIFRKPDKKLITKLRKECLSSCEFDTNFLLEFRDLIVAIIPAAECVPVEENKALHICPKVESRKIEIPPCLKAILAKSKR